MVDYPLMTRHNNKNSKTGLIYGFEAPNRHLNKWNFYEILCTRLFYDGQVLVIVWLFESVSFRFCKGKKVHHECEKDQKNRKVQEISDQDCLQQ